MLIFLSQTIQWSQNDSIQLPWSEVAKRSKTDSRGSTQTPAICFNHVQSKVRLNQALNQIICYDQLNVSWPVFLNSKRQWLAVDDLKSQHCTHRTSWYLTISIYFHPRRLHSLLWLLHLRVNKYQIKLFCQGLDLTGRSGPLSHSVAPIGRNVLELPEPLVIMMQSLV